MLSEGQREGDVEVVSINELAGVVKVSYDGTLLTLDFTNNAAKAVASSAAPPPGVGGGPGAAPPRRLNAAWQAPAAPGSKQPSSSPNDNRRPLRPVGGMGGTPAPTGMGAAQFGQAAEAPPPIMTPEQQAVLMEAMREQQRNDPTMPPLPPTPLTPLIEAANQEGAAVPTANPGIPRYGLPPPAPALPGRPF